MKIGIFQDVHANLPAFRKAIEVFREHGCKQIYHVGDLIGIGPHPREVLEFVIDMPELVFIMGNHDHWYAFGLPQPLPAYMNEEEVAHHRWTHQQLGEAYRSAVKKWPFYKSIETSGGLGISFQHYGYDEETNWFKDFVKEPNSEKLNGLFAGYTSDLIFYGHDHRPSDLTGNSRYLNLGEWMNYETYAVFDGKELHLKEWKK